MPRQQCFQWNLCNGNCLLQTSKLILTSKRDGSALAATMVFALRAEVDARGPLKRFKADAQLYEFKEFEVKLTNPFQVKPAGRCLVALAVFSSLKPPCLLDL